MKNENYEAFNQYTIQRLESSEKIESFDCGDAILNDFVLNQSSLYRTEKLAVSYALKSKENPHDIVAFFSLSNDKISISDFDSKTKYNRFSRRFKNRKRLKSYFSLYNQTGCRFLTVDAYYDAIPFYQKTASYL